MYIASYKNQFHIIMIDRMLEDWLINSKRSSIKSMNRISFMLLCHFFL